MYHYKTISIKELPDRFSHPLGLAINRLDDMPHLCLLIDASPHESEIEQETRVGGWCLYEPPIIYVVVRTLETTLHTLYHEYWHHKAHHKFFREKGSFPTKQELFAIDEMIENDADQAASIMLEDFKSWLAEKDPLMYRRGEHYSKQWMNEKPFTDHNNSVKRDYSKLPQWMIDKEISNSLQLIKNHKITS
jgi:hypothetical protein